MSYALRNAVYASGIETLTVPGIGSLASLNVKVTGMVKTDTVLITFNQNENAASLTVNQIPWIYNQLDGEFNVTMNLDNSDPAVITCLLNWAVIR